MGYVDKAVQTLLGSSLLHRFVILDGSKIADITHADTNEHTLTPSALGLPDNVIAVLVTTKRVSGTGAFAIRTTTGGSSQSSSNNDQLLWPMDLTGVFRYSLTVGNDDWDLFCHAVITEGRP